MEALTVLLLCIWTVGASGSSFVEVTLKADRPSLRVKVNSEPSLKCCYYATEKVENTTWVARYYTPNGTVRVKLFNDTHVIYKGEEGGCHKLIFKQVSLNDSGLYQCLLTHEKLKSSVFTHGTYLQVYEPMVRTLDISESSKNSILIAEGVLLMLGVLLPGTMMLCKSKKGNELKKRKIIREEENIYEGLNLEECISAYDQVQRSLVQGPYQDVGNVMIEEEEEEEEIQLEKP